MTAAIPPELIMYTARGWPVLALEPREKRPLGAACPNGVKDATTDLTVIAEWCARWPDANWGIACGKPGPQVLDIDDPAKVPPEVMVAIRGAPRAATARGGHVYFEGTDAGTVALGYGELRGRGSYVVAPPSTHPTGKVYTLIKEPRGKLPASPKAVVRTAKPTWGAGDMATTGAVAPGGMYDHLGDLATRLARAGLTNADVIERMLTVEFDAVRDRAPVGYGCPVQGRLDTRRLAEWAAGSEIAGREAARVAGLARVAEAIRMRNEKRSG